MLPNLVIQELTNDCEILLRRALLGKTLACFGADGDGEYGQSYYAKHYLVKGINVTILQDSDENTWGLARITLDGYDSSVFGHVVTDNNLRISMNREFANEFIESSCWTWADITEQGEDFFTIQFETNKLLGW